MRFRSPLSRFASAIVVILATTFSARSAEPKKRDAKPAEGDAAIIELLNKPAPPRAWEDFVREHGEVRPVKPPSSAPLEALVEYWRYAPDNIQPDAETEIKLLEACEKDPVEVFWLLRFLPTDSEDSKRRLKALYDRLAKQHNPALSEVANFLWPWLVVHTNYFKEERLRLAFPSEDSYPEQAKVALDSSIRLDPEATRTALIAKSNDSNIKRRAIALSGLMKGFRNKYNRETVESWRQELIRIASDPSVEAEVRSIAFAGAVAENCTECQDWYFESFRHAEFLPKDNGSSNGISLSEVAATNPDYWIPRIGQLLGAEGAVRANAVNCLLYFLSTPQLSEKWGVAVTNLLLPWLDDPNWVPEPSDRLTFLKTLAERDFPKCRPALLKEIERSTGSQLDEIAELLASHDAKEAVEPLKAALHRQPNTMTFISRGVSTLPDPEPHLNRVGWDKVIRALIRLHAFNVGESLPALRAYAKKMSTAKGQQEAEFPIGNPSLGLDFNIGQAIAEADNDNNELSRAVLEEAKKLAKSDQATAGTLENIAIKWSTPSSHVAFVARVRRGDVSSRGLGIVISRRRKVTTSFPATSGLRGTARGVDAALSADPSAIREVIKTGDKQARVALLACARTGRFELPIEAVAQLLDSQNEKIRSAADRYLETIDTLPARAELLKRAKGKARIVGSKWQVSEEVDPGWTGPLPFEPEESKLRDELLRTDGPADAFALFSGSSWGDNEEEELLVFNDHAVLRAKDSNGRSREQQISLREATEFRSWAMTQRFGDLPWYDSGAVDAPGYYYVHITRDGGERVGMNRPPSVAVINQIGIAEAGGVEPDGILYADLVRGMERFFAKPMQVQYESLQKLPGFEIVQAKEEGEISRLRYQGNQLFVGLAANQSTEWHRVTNSGISHDISAQNEDEDTTWEEHSEYHDVAVREGPLAGKKLSIFDRDNQPKGLWALPKDGKPELLAKGAFEGLLVCPGGEWILVSKNIESGGKALVRINVPTKRVFDVDLPAIRIIETLVWINARKRVIVYRYGSGTGSNGPEKTELHLLDPVTGSHEKVRGEFRPFFDARDKALQPTGRPNEFWAALHDERYITDHPPDATVIGRFNTFDFHFEPVLKFPKVEFASKNFFVDEAAHVVWINVNGDLLRADLPK